MFTLPFILQDKNPGMSFGNGCDERTYDRRLMQESSTMRCLSRPIRNLTSLADYNRTFTFKKRVGITSQESIALSKKFDRMTQGEKYKGKKAIIKSISSKTHYSVSSKPIAKTYKITLEADQSTLAGIAYLDFGIKPSSFEKLCPSYQRLDERKIVYTLSLSLEHEEISQLKSEIDNILSSVSDFHGLSVQHLPSSWYKKIWLAITRQKELRVRFEGKSLAIKSIVNAIKIDSAKIRKFTHEYQMTD